jgi:hypothetical protein
MKYYQQLMLHCIKTYGIVTVILLYAPFLGVLVMYG